jgi:hypothetical protein
MSICSVMYIGKIFDVARAKNTNRDHIQTRRIFGQVTVYRICGVLIHGLRKIWRFLVVKEEYIWAATKGLRLDHRSRAHYS